MRYSTARLLATGIVFILAAIVLSFTTNVVNSEPLLLLFGVGVVIIALALLLARLRL
jgi:hypothetical protein